MPRDYSYTEMMQMQEQAMKRVQDMQKRARQTAETAKFELEDEPPPKPVQRQYDYTPITRPTSPTGLPISMDSPKSTDSPKHIPMPVHFPYNAEPKNNNVQLIKKNADSSPFAAFMEEPDKAMILAVLLLLKSENADELLMMALLYILV